MIGIESAPAVIVQLHIFQKLNGATFIIPVFFITGKIYLETV